MSIPGAEEGSIVLLALTTVYVVVREILVPTFRKDRHERRQEDRPQGHFKCEAGRFDQRITMLEDHDRTDDRRIVTLTKKVEGIDEKLIPMGAQLDVVVERVDWLVKAGGFPS